MEGDRQGVQGGEGRRGQDRDRRLQHLRGEAQVRDVQELRSDPVPGQRPCGSGQLEGLLLRPVRQPAVRRADQRLLRPEGRRRRCRYRLRYRDLRHHL